MSIQEVMLPALIADIVSSFFSLLLFFHFTQKIFCSRENNTTSRKAALQMLIKMTHRAIADEEDGMFIVNHLIIN